ncbi:hypothetical protein F5884DRAFT_739888 [Xylogone sp. PMI_703]|nr:hypothetical protein F5884DRAFT_739888 [Xylogone sp. PMI_703]
MDRTSRAKLAKKTIHDVIPHILRTNPRARAGIQGTQLVHESRSQPAHSPPRIRVIQSDTLNAVQELLADKPKASHGRVAVLNMASELRPGGGVLNGSVAQEEVLCMRSTLYHSLDNSFYRIPEDAAIYSPDILVFRDSNNQDLAKSEWFFTDVISCPGIRGPEVNRDPTNGTLSYANGSDVEIMTTKARLIFQIAKHKGITHLVLGALGCGVFRNPPREVAKIFRRVILGDKKRAGIIGIEEVVFAIIDDGENLRSFKDVFEEPWGTIG